MAGRRLVVVERIQKEHFDQIQNQYDIERILNPPLHVQKEINAICRLVEDHGCSSIVDFGSGTGRLALPLLRMGKNVIAVDISGASLQRLSDLACSQGLLSNLAISHVLPMGVDCIVGADILHHVHLDSALQSIYEALNPDGLIVFSEPNALHPAWVMLHTYPTWRWPTEKGLFSCTVGSFHRRLAKKGFRDIRIQGFGLFPPPLLNRVPVWQNLDIRLSKRYPFLYLAYRLLVTARK